MTDDINQLLMVVGTMYDKGVVKNRIERLTIHQFRKFASDSEISFTFPLTVIVGKNGSGKTTVMKALKLLSNIQMPQNEFFETSIDDGGFEGANISYKINGEMLNYRRIKQNEWGKTGNAPSRLNISYIQTKTIVGAIDKSLFYDDIGKNTTRIQKVEYIIKQSRKLLQNPKSVSERKQRHMLSNGAISALNFILKSNVKSIEVVRHKYYSGTWGTSVIFNDGNRYSEYNAGSGEFAIANIVDLIDRIPSESIFLIDEPEISLHPGAQSRLMCFLLEIIKQKKLQIIIATHSPSIVESLPKSAIKCLRKIENDVIAIQEQVFYKEAFIELEFDHIGQKRLIVEDDMAKNIILKILKQENLSDLLRVEFYPGGASNIKQHTLLTYSKTQVTNQYICLDGDQLYYSLPNFKELTETQKELKNLKDIFLKVTNINSDKIAWGVNANSAEGRFDISQERELILRYLEYFQSHVFFLPKKIPEDIIYNEAILKRILGETGFPNLSGKETSKEKLHIISETMSQELSVIESLLIYWFLKEKNDDYQYILKILIKIVEG